MKVQVLAMSMILSASLVIGCDDEQKKAEQPAQQPAVTEKPAVTLTPATQPIAAVDITPVKAPETKPAVDKAVEDAKADAIKLLGDLKTAVENKKWSEAKDIIKKLEAMKDKLSADQLTSMENLKKIISAADLTNFRLP